VKKNGLSRHGKQRWRCHECGYAFVWRNDGAKYAKERTWFELWIQEGYSVRQLQKQSHHSPAKLYRIIAYWLARPPERTGELNQYRYLVFDGTYIQQRKGLVATMDDESHSVIDGLHGLTENRKHVDKYLTALKQRGLNPYSVTLDGNPSVILAFRAAWPDITIQRCLVHVQRQGLRWCRRYPKRTDAKHLRKLLLTLSDVDTIAKRNQFLKDFAVWEKRFGKKIKDASTGGWVFSDLKKARSMLIGALPDMFHYLKNPAIPNSSNGIEGYFSRLKHHYRQHRGLSVKSRTNYFQWYFKLCPR
jgi:hypothetical protein